MSPNKLISHPVYDIYFRGTIEKEQISEYYLYKLEEQSQNKPLGKMSACFLLKFPKENEAHMNNFNFRSLWIKEFVCNPRESSVTCIQGRKHIIQVMGQRGPKQTLVM